MAKNTENDLYIGDEYTEEEVIEEEPQNVLEGLYDLMIQPGVPESLIIELVEEFDLDPVMRMANVKTAVGTGEREILVLRGDLESVNSAHDYMVQKLHDIPSEFKSPLVKD